MQSPDDVTMEWLMEGKIDSRANLSLARMTVAVGATSELHRHPNCTETIHVIDGEISQRVDDNWAAMRAGETCLVPIGSTHQTRNTGGVCAVMIIAYSAGQRDYRPL